MRFATLHPRLFLRASAAFCALALATPTVAAAREDEASLEGAMRSLFEASPTFRVYDVRTREAEALHLRASGPFDLVAGAGVEGKRVLWQGQRGGLTNDGFNDLGVQASLGTRTRENIELQVSGGTPVVTTLDLLRSPNQPRVTANLTIPLLKLGRSASFGAEERASALHASAMGALQEDAQSDLATQVAESYWRWVGSYEQLKLARQIEALATEQLRDVDQLIEQHARAAADRLPFAAAAESAGATRTHAEQAMFEQQEITWETLGLAGPASLVLPSAELPEIPASPEEPGPIARRAHERSRTRPLLAYLDQEITAAGVRGEAARLNKRPDLSLYTQATAARVEDSVVNTEPRLGYYGVVGLQISAPLQNRAARGDYDYASRVRDEQALAALQGHNAIDARVEALSRALASLARSYQQRARAADEFRLAYEAQRARFRVGSATGLEVVVAEQQLMVASLQVVADRTSYAVALAKLLHESGVLNAAVRSRDAGAVVRRLTNPTF